MDSRITESKNTVLIWGAGAVGGTIGAYLARARLPLCLADVVAEHVNAMNTRGLTIKGPVDEFTVTINASTPDNLLGKISSGFTLRQGTGRDCGRANFTAAFNSDRLYRLNAEWLKRKHHLQHCGP